MSGRKKVIGVLGGMGPAATLDFLSKLLAATPAQGDQDHIRVLVDSNPTLPDRNQALAGRGPSPAAELARMAAGLEHAGAEGLVMTCNTAHAFQAEIEAVLSIPFLSMIDATVEATLTAVPEVRRVGLLAAAGCIQAGLYQNAFAARGIETLPVDEQAFMAVVYGVKRGDVGPASAAAMRRLAQSLVDGGADVLVAACTEVPLVLGPQDTSVPLVESTTALVERTVRFALD